MRSKSLKNKWLSDVEWSLQEKCYKNAKLSLHFSVVGSLLLSNIMLNSLHFMLHDISFTSYKALYDSMNVLIRLLVTDSG